jgi:hypothetical protein
LIRFEHNLQKRLMQQTLQAECDALSVDVVSRWRDLWMEELTQWHSPYKALIDARAVKVLDESVRQDLKDLFAFFEGFFMRQAVAVVAHPEMMKDWPIPACLNLEEAQKLLGLRLETRAKEAVDFRDQIVLQHFFEQHTMELSFASPVIIDSLEKVQILRSKIINNLSQWHSKWNLMIDCQNLTLVQDLNDEWAKLFKFLKGLFMKQVVGYQGVPSQAWPFVMYRSRHKAAALLEGEGDQLADKADCQSRKA